MTKHPPFFTCYCRCPCCHVGIEACAPWRKSVSGGTGSCPQRWSFRQNTIVHRYALAHFAGLQPHQCGGFVSSCRPTSPYSQEPRRHFFGHTRPIEVLEGFDDGLGDSAWPWKTDFLLQGGLTPSLGLANQPWKCGKRGFNDAKSSAFAI